MEELQIEEPHGEEESKIPKVGDVYTWGSGEMGQLGQPKQIILNMPKDRDGYGIWRKHRYPFQVFPTEVRELRNCSIESVNGGEGYTVCISSDGSLYTFGASACGQLGLPSLKNLPIDVEGYPYQPSPTLLKTFLSTKVWVKESVR